MPTAVATRLAWVTLAVILSMWTAGTVLWATSERRLIFDRNHAAPGSAVVTTIEEAGDGTNFELRASLVFLLAAPVGAVVAARRPRNPIGWLLCVSAASLALRWFANGMAAHTAATIVPPSPLPPALVTLLWISHPLSVLSVGVLAPVLLLFPNGRLPSPRWRIVLGMACFGFTLVLIARALTPEVLRGWPFMANPYGWPAFAPVFGAVYRVGAFCLTTGLILAAASVILRTRHASAEERTQLKWLAYGGTLLALTFPAAALGTLRGSELGAWQGPLQALNLSGVVAFLACLAIAILRHRLYDIDILINRTLVYAVLAAVIAVGYVGTVVGLGTLIGRLGDSSLVLSLAATALVAVAFAPVRERVQRAVDRLVYGERANPYEVLASFARRVANGLSVEEVLPQMAEVAGAGVGAVRSRVRVFLPTGGERAAEWPPGSGDGAPLPRSVVVSHQGERVGEIAVAKAPGEQLTLAEEKLLADLASQAGPALSNVRLTEELRANLRALATQAEELRASRQRIVAAQDAARRQLERDVHDGAQQHLVALAVTLRLARQTAEKDPAKLRPLLDDLIVQATEALETLRALARGLFPAILADRGLASALRSHLSRAYPRAALDPGPLELERFAPDVEAGVYFCCLEALQNAGKHAAGAAVAVRLDRIEGWLTFEVRDEGPGFAPGQTNGGSGLMNMADRMAALGGSLQVKSAPGQGTTVTGRAPTHASAESRLVAS
jgi:signal transduction histidine kinase